MSDISKWDGERLETFVFNEATVEHLHRYAIAIELVKGKSVLDIACGEGYGAALLAENASHVTGIDIDGETIHKAKQKYKRARLDFLEGNAENIPVETAQFDVVVSFETIEHLADHDNMMKEMKRVLKPGGILVISTPDKANYTDNPGTKNPFHLRELYKEEFVTLLKNYFSFVDCYGQQVSHSSVITSSNEGLQHYHGDYDRIQSGKTSNFLYHIALASDAPLPALPSSIFNGNSVMQKALELKEKMVTGTITYKTGHALLYPFKAIRSLFKK